MYKLKHCREYFTKNKVRGAWPSTLFFVKYEQGDALNDLWNFLVLRSLQPYSKTCN